MSNTFYFVSFVFIAICPAFVASRVTPHAGWVATLEPYDVYHHRYVLLECHEKHGTHFFNQCCRPLLASELPSKQCTPPTVANSDTGEYCEELDHLVASTKPTNRLIGKDNPDVSHSLAISARRQLTTSATSTAIETSVWPTLAHISGPSRLASMKKHGHVIASMHQPTRSNTGQVNTGGYATYFYQDGNAGACGTVHSDNDLIAAIDSDRYGFTGARSDLCGKKVKITNPSNGKTVLVTIADACPTCRNSNSIDLSLGAFKTIAELSQGIVSITWVYA
ncbi:expansin family protein [Amanita muscaria]